MPFKEGNLNPSWKGDDAGNQALHQWINKHFGKPKICEKCGTTDKTKRYVWARTNGHVKSRDRKDYIRLCQGCHLHFDFPEHRYDPRKRKYTNEELKIVKQNQGSEFGKLRMENMTPEERTELARHAAVIRWSKTRDNKWTGKHHTEETKAKLRVKALLRNQQRNINNKES
jgi:hypothetical protein